MCDSRKDKLWHQVIPELAHTHPFLMHEVLAVSALHLQYIRPDEVKKWSLVASQHQGLALPLFRAELSRLNEHNCRALFAMASMLAVSSMTSIAQGMPDDDHDTSSLDALVQMFALTRGLYTSLAPLWHVLMQPPFDILAQGADLKDHEQRALPTEMKAQVNRLHALCDEANIDHSYQQAYKKGLVRLEEIYKGLLYMNPAERDDMAMVIRWAVSSEEEIVAMISERDPLALVILAHYVILLSGLNRWYVDGLSQRMWIAITHNLPDSIDIQDLLLWPKKQLDEGLPAFSGGKFPRLP